jgi:Flp pilus assembly protein TadD
VQLAGRLFKSALMSSRLAQILIVVCLTGLGGCASSTKLSALWTPKSTDSSNATATDAGQGTPGGSDTTGSVVTQPAEQPAADHPVAELSPPGLSGDDPNDDVNLGKKYFRSNNFGLAERSFRSAVEKHPHDAAAWVGLAASYDRLRRFDLADRAYAEAIKIVGLTPEVLNNEGFSYMLRGDYARAQKALEQAQAKDPANPYVQANLDLLTQAFHDGKAVQ